MLRLRRGQSLLAYDTYTALLATHTPLWIDGYLLPKEMVFQLSNDIYYACHELEINANLYPLTRTSMENLFLDMGHFNWIIYAKNFSEVMCFNHTRMKDVHHHGQ